ncbi:MAG: sialate O-acetylesterase [Clostridiales bacterium]|nr:sialate O-acetylesterase [Clostridiales bacterium]
MNLLTTAPIFQSHMVLQRDKPMIIWGQAPGKTSVTVCLRIPSAAPQTATASPEGASALSGTWKCTLPPQPACENASITITCDHPSCETITLTQISIGDIWLACGQSNMEFFLRYDTDWEHVKAYDKNPKIHMYNVPQLAFEGQQRDTTGYGCWLEEGDIGFDSFSAPGYSFARNLQPHIDVPIGIIGCNWGGSTAAAWLDESCLANEPLAVYLREYQAALQEYPTEEMTRRSLEAWDFEISERHTQEFMPLLYGRNRAWQERYMKEHENDPFVPMGPYNINRPGGLYHQMLEPLIPFAIKGVLWYQGESDACHADLYDKLMTSLITWWRGKWQDELPFLFVQLAPFGVWLACDSKGYAIVRKKQELVSKTVPHTGMASIMDIGAYYDIHPKQKMEVGRRLALLARGKVYGEDILCESPEYLSAVRERTESAKSSALITLSFTNCGSLHRKELAADDISAAPKSIVSDGTHASINCTDGITGFVLLQENREIPITSITIKGASVALTAEALTDAPCTLQFAWADYAVVNLCNEAGLPIKPFQCEV